MLSVNQQIMREIHNEQSDLESSLDGYEVFKEFKDRKYLDDESKTLLWKITHLERTFFGKGFIDEHLGDDQQSDENDEEVNELLNYSIKGFLIASLKYDKNKKQEPLEFLGNQISELFSEHAQIELDQEQMIDFLASLIECESLASWLLVSKLPLNTIE